MLQWDKLIQRILSLSEDVRFEDLRKILLYYGYVESTPGNGSSHHTFRKDQHDPITLSKHGRMKRIYVVIVRKVIEQEEALK